MKTNKNILLSVIEGLSYFIVLLLFVLIVNFPAISFNMMYPEQATLYHINQKITNLSELINIYLHPKMLSLFIPFFRPSGHFLIYQIVMPFLGWHNTKGLIILNLIFLALTGYVLVKLYRKLFPGFLMGGYIAFGIYLMHPALSLSRFVVMHFEFAHTFLLLLCLYYFVLFCESLQKIKWLVASLLVYALAITFKETTLMLGPVLIVYFLISLYKGSFTSIFSAFREDKKYFQIFLLLSAVTVTLALYLSLQWTSLYHPLRGDFKFKQVLGAANLFFNNLVGTHYDLFANTDVINPDSPWRILAFPYLVRVILWCLFVLMLVKTFIVFFTKSHHRKVIVFLYISSFLFLAMPFLWTIGAPWHLCLSLLFISLLLGFCVESILQHVSKNKHWVDNSSLVITLFLGCLAIPVNQANIDIYKTSKPNMFLALLINRNAVLSPPDIKKQLKNDSIIVVEDRFIHSGYFLGNGDYPFHLLGHFDYPRLERILSPYYLSFHPNYNGNLFKWAYLMPSIREQIYPFKIERMETVANEIIYNWLQHSNNIFCLSYDMNAEWHDSTSIFKKNLLVEKNSRHLVVNHYKLGPAFKGEIAYSKDLPFPDEKLCEYVCDQDRNCKGFVYINNNLLFKRTIQCDFYKTIIHEQEKLNSQYAAYMKIDAQAV